MDSFMGCNSIVMIENLNGCICYSHIDLIFDILMRHRVVHFVYSDVIIELYDGFFPFAHFKAGSR